MKNIINIIAAIIFSTLFYKQAIGLNLSLFTLLTIIILSITNIEILKEQKSIFVKMLLYLISGVMVFFNNSNLVITANIIAFVTFVGSFSENKVSIYILWLNGIYTSVVSVFATYFDNLKNDVTSVKKRNINILYWAKLLIPTVLIITLFISLYRSGNPLFDDLISNIDFTFINFQWILLTAVGYYLFNNITNPLKIDPATELDLKTANELYDDLVNKDSKEKLVQENQFGLILMVLLNILIAIYLVTDVLFINKIQYLTAVELSQQVHSGINSLIISIVFAIAIILYFFRGDLNFFEKSKNLKTFTFVWIFLNFLLSIITAYKNFEYLSTFGLTYKRIGVLVYLLLTIIGLATTFIKVYSIKNLWFLLRRNCQIAFGIFIVSATINWDNLITNYNINYAEQTDYDYLINLPNNNAFLLNEFAEYNTQLNSTTKSRIHLKFITYENKLKNNSWKELVYDNLKTQKN